MTTEQIINTLREYNAWRWDGEGQMPDPKEVGKAIDAACDALEESSHWKAECEIVSARLRGQTHPNDNGIISDDEIIPRLERERDEARAVLGKIALYLSVGMGDKSITAKQYHERILDGIKMLTDPLMDSWKQAERERDEAREAFVIATDKMVQAQCKTREALRELDEAREALDDIAEYGTEEINAAVDLRHALAAALVERDEAREQLAAWKEARSE